MTAHLYVTLWCDHEFVPATGHRPCSDRYDEPFETTPSGARANARKLGWRTKLSPRRDLCPEHARSSR